MRKILYRVSYFSQFLLFEMMILPQKLCSWRGHIFLLIIGKKWHLRDINGSYSLPVIQSRYVLPEQRLFTPYYYIDIVFWDLKLSVIYLFPQFSETFCQMKKIEETSKMSFKLVYINIEPQQPKSRWNSRYKTSFNELLESLFFYQKCPLQARFPKNLFFRQVMLVLCVIREI